MGRRITPHKAAMGDALDSTNDYKLGHPCALFEAYPPASEVVKADLSGYDVAFHEKRFQDGRKDQAVTIRGYFGDLKAAIDRYERYRSLGVEAVSQFDINICYQGDARLALQGSMATLYNHIISALLYLSAARKFASGLVDYVEREQVPTSGSVAAAAPVHEVAQLALF